MTQKMFQSEKTLLTHNAPEKLMDLAKNWFQQGKSFYLGPENIFYFNSQPITYKGGEDLSKVIGNWYICTSDCRAPQYLELTKNEIEEISYALNKFRKWEGAFIYVGDRCNAQCIMCSYHGKDKEFHQTLQKNECIELDFETVKRRIDKCYDMGIRGGSIISNGEILLHKDWYNMTKYAASKFDWLYFITNGFLFDEKTAEQIKDIQKITTAQVSLHATTFETWSKITGCKSQKMFENAMNAPLLLKKAGVPNVSVTFVSMEENKHEREEFINYWNSKVDDVRIIYCSKRDDYPENKYYQRKEEPIGLCAADGGIMLVMPSGLIIPCCACFMEYHDSQTLNLPKLNIETNTKEEIMERFKNLVFEGDFKELCKYCYMNVRLANPFPIEVEFNGTKYQAQKIGVYLNNFKKIDTTKKKKTLNRRIYNEISYFTKKVLKVKD